jgi:hypothetical protein
MAGNLAIVALLLDRGAHPNRGNDYGWTKLHNAGYGNDCELAKVLLTPVPALTCLPAAMAGRRSSRRCSGAMAGRRSSRRCSGAIAK